MIKKEIIVDVLAIKFDTCYISAIKTSNSTRENIKYKYNCVTNKIQ